MRLVLSLALFAALAFVSSAVNRIRFTPGQTYVYDYSSRLLTGVPSVGDQWSGFEMKADLVLQAQSESLVAMTLANIQLGKHNGPIGDAFVGDLPIEHQMNALYNKELSKSVRFVYENGKVKAFEADVSEPEWSLNMKKAILSLLSVDLMPKKIMKSAQSNIVRPEAELVVYPVYEEGIGGICETLYEIAHIADPKYGLSEHSALNVTKTRNYDNCLTEPTIASDNYDVRGCPWVCRKDKSFSAVRGYYPSPDAVADVYMSGCPCGREPHESPVDAYAFAKYNISRESNIPTIEGIYSEGRIAYSTNGDTLLVLTQQNITLNVRGSARVSIPSIPRPQRHTELSFRLPKPSVAEGSQVPLDIPYYALFGNARDANELQNIIPELLDSLAEDIVSGELSAAKDSMQKSVQMVNAMAVLPQESLLALYEEVAQNGNSARATQKQQVIRKLFLDALPLAGSNPAALFIAYLIQQGKVTTLEAKEMVEAVPQNLFLADTRTIDAYLELFQSPKVQSRRHLAASAGIAFGKMVKEACVKRQTIPGDIPDGNPVPHPKRNLAAQLVVQSATPQQRVTVQSTAFSSRMRRSAEWEESFPQDVCDQSDVEKYVQIIARLLSQAKTFPKKVALIETLAHMGVPQVLPVFEPYIRGDLEESQCPGYVVEQKETAAEECDFVRRVIVYGLKHVTEFYPKQVSALLHPLYSDRSESYELRIAAFTTLVFADPEAPILARIASELHSEPNRQIRSFVSSALETISNSTWPCQQSMAKKAFEALKQAPDQDFGQQYSQMNAFSFFDNQKDFGLVSLFNYVANNVSYIPRAGYWSIGQTSGPFQDDLLQLGFQAKGMEGIIARALGNEGVVYQMFDALAKGKDRRISKRSVDSAQEALEALKNQLNLAIRSDDDPKATVFFKLFDRTSYYAFDKHYIHALIDEAEDVLKDIAQILIQGKSFHYVKLVMPSQLYKVVPSEIGLPVVFTHRHPIVLSLKVEAARLQIASQPKTVIPSALNISAQIQPAIYYSSYAFAFAINTADRQAYGAHVQKTTHATIPAEIAFGISRPKSQITWSVVPRETEVVYHKTQTQTFIAKANIAGAPDRDWLEEAKEVKRIAVPLQHEMTIGQEQMGIGLKIQMNSENPFEPLNAWDILGKQAYNDHGYIPALIESWRNPGLYAREGHIQIASDPEEPIQGYDFTIKYKWISDEEESADEDDSDESSASNESDSDQSDESSASQSSESKSSESDESDNKKSSKSKSDSSKSSKSSEESNESNLSLKKRIKNRMAKVVNEINRRRRDASKNYKSERESTESSDESSNESGSKSFSKSGSKESSQSSSSESNSSEEKQKKKKNSSKYKSASAQSSESSSSSSESDESVSFEDSVFDYEDVMKLILAQDFKRRNVKRISQTLIKKTKSAWHHVWDADDDISEQTIAHDIVFSVVARGPRPSYYAANVLYIHTFDHRITWLQTDGHVKRPKGVYATLPTLFCADAVIAYPTIPNEFYYETLEGQKARIEAHVGWGEQCAQKGGVIVAGVMEQTEDHVIPDQALATQDGSSAAHVQHWYKRQCAIDRSSGQSLSYACERSIIDESFFNRLIVDLKYKSVPKGVQNFTRKAFTALQVALYHHLDLNAVDAHNPEEQIRLVAHFSKRIPDIPLATLHIHTPDQTAVFERVHIPHIRPPSALLPFPEVLSNLWSGYEGLSDSQCALMEDFVRTFDNVTLKTEATPCQYLLAKDCSARERFAVFAQNHEIDGKTKRVTVMTSGSEIRLVPPQSQTVAQVVVDGKARDLQTDKAITIGAQNKNFIRVYLRATPSDAHNPIIVVESEAVTVKYDGKNAKVIVGAQFKGKTCGVCGDNNDESEDEFSGPDMCVYDEEEDFFNAYALSGEQCAQKPIPKGQKRCPHDIENDVIHTKVKTIAGKTIISQEIQEGEASRAQRSQIVANQANVEQIQRQQQQQVENQMARQEGETLSPAEQQSLYSANPQQQKLIQRLKTQYIERDDMICFTTKPVLYCVTPSQASALKQIKADFHCLPKTSPFTQQLIIESEKQVIRQLVNKRVDLRQQIEVPVSCV
jgi:hypothetical protein